MADVTKNYWERRKVHFVACDSSSSEDYMTGYLVRNISIDYAGKQQYVTLPITLDGGFPPSLASIMANVSGITRQEGLSQHVLQRGGRLEASLAARKRDIRRITPYNKTVVVCKCSSSLIPDRILRTSPCKQREVQYVNSSAVQSLGKSVVVCRCAFS